MKIKIMLYAIYLMLLEIAGSPIFFDSQEVHIWYFFSMILFLISIAWDILSYVKKETDKKEAQKEE